MEFNFRTNGGNPSNYNYAPTTPHHSSSTLSYFSEQSLRAGYMPPNRNENYFPNHRNNLPESVIREIEKQRIREEMERKLELEAEVRREMMLEREMAMRGGHPRDFPFYSGPPNMLLNSNFPFFNQHENRSRDLMPFTRKPEVRITEMKASPEVINKERITLMPRREGNISGIKRKEITPPPTNAKMSSSDLNKKIKETLRCDLCKVSSTSEHALNEHFRGKKHKSRVAKQASHITGKNYAIGLFSRKVTESPENKPTDTIKEESLVIKEKPKEEVFENSEDVKNDEGEKKKKRENLKFEFWCEMCKIGTFSKKVMNAHKRGKKHTSRLLDDLSAKLAEKEKNKKNDFFSETVFEKEIIEEKQDIADVNKESEENEKGEDSNGSERAVSPLLISWIE